MSFVALGQAQSASTSDQAPGLDLTMNAVVVTGSAPATTPVDASL